MCKQRCKEFKHVFETGVENHEGKEVVTEKLMKQRLEQLKGKVIDYVNVDNDENELQISICFKDATALLFLGVNDGSTNWPSVDMDLIEFQYLRRKQNIVVDSKDIYNEFYRKDKKELL